MQLKLPMEMSSRVGLLLESGLRNLEPDKLEENRGTNIDTSWSSRNLDTPTRGSSHGKSSGDCS